MNRGCILLLATAIASPSLMNAEDDFDVAAAWEKDCRSCHAEDGSGLTKKGRKLRVRDYRSAEVQAEMKDGEMIEAIKKGVEKKGEEVMNPYAEDYSDAEIQQFVTFIRSLAK